MDIAIDFDGTIVRNRWPKIGRLRFLAKPVIKWLKSEGMINPLYLPGRDLLERACFFLGVHGIEFKHCNKNTEERITEYGGDCRKISADLYLDDKALFPAGGLSRR